MTTKDDALIEAMTRELEPALDESMMEHHADEVEHIVRSALAVARAAILEEAAMLLHETRGNILLHCGEMTAQELRSVEAVLRWKQAAIRALANKEAE